MDGWKAPVLQVRIVCTLRSKGGLWQGRSGHLNFAVGFVAWGEDETVGKSNFQGLVEKLVFSPVTFNTLGQFGPAELSVESDGNILYLHFPTEKPLATSP